MRIHAILLAAGDGNRFGGELPKQFLRLAGEQVLARSLRTVAAAGVDRIVVVAHPDWMSETDELVAAVAPTVPTTVVAGGATRNRAPGTACAASRRTRPTRSSSTTRSARWCRSR